MLRRIVRLRFLPPQQQQQQHQLARCFLSYHNNTTDDEETLRNQQVSQQAHQLLGEDSLSHSSWMVAEDTLWSLSNMHTLESVDLSVLLLDKLVTQSPLCSDSRYIDFLGNFDLLHSILYNWHQVSKRSGNESNITMTNQGDAGKTPCKLPTSITCIEPEKLYTMLHDWGRTVNLDFFSGRNLSLLMEVASRQAKQLYDHSSNSNSSQDISQQRLFQLAEFTEKLFYQMLDKESTIHYLPPSAVNLNFCLANWSYTGNIERAWKLKNAAVDRDILHDRISYNILLKLYATHGRGPDAQRIVEELLSQDDPELQPDVRTYNTAILAWSNSRADPMESARRTQMLLDRMVQQQLRPNLRTFNAVLSCWARAGQADMCETLLTELHQLSLAGKLDEPPDAYSYNAVLNAFAKSGQPEKAETLCDEMCSAFLHQDRTDLKPALSTFTCVMEAYSRKLAQVLRSESGGLEAFELTKSARRVFDRMEELHQFGILPAHDTASYNNMLFCYHKCSNVQTAPVVNRSAEHADQLLSTMVSNGVQPDFRSYSVVIQAWLQRPDGVKRAMELLDAVWKLHEERKLVKVDAQSLHAIVVGLCRRDRADLAEKLLWEWCRLRREDPSRVQSPVVKSFGSIMGNLSQDDEPDRAEKGEKLFDEMLKLRREGVIKAAPDKQFVESLIRMWTYSGKLNAHLKAYDLLSKLRHEANRKREMQPDVNSYIRVAFACSEHRPADPLTAEKVMYDMYADYKAGKLVGRPLKCEKGFNSALSAWVYKGGGPSALSRIEALYSEMTRLHDSGELQCCDHVTKGIILNALATVSPTLENAAKAESLLDQWSKQFKAGRTVMRPDANRYGSVIQAWCRAGNAKRANALLLDMYEQFRHGDESMKPKFKHFDDVVDAWEQSKSPDASDRAMTVLHLRNRVYRTSGEWMSSASASS